MENNNLTMTMLVKYLNETLVKKNNKVFNTSDVQGYIRRGKLPDYLGANKIEINLNIPGIKLYKII